MGTSSSIKERLKLFSSRMGEKRRMNEGERHLFDGRIRLVLFGRMADISGAAITQLAEEQERFELLQPGGNLDLQYPVCLPQLVLLELATSESRDKSFAARAAAQGRRLVVLISGHDGKREFEQFERANRDLVSGSIDARADGAKKVGELANRAAQVASQLRKAVAQLAFIPRQDHLDVFCVSPTSKVVSDALRRVTHGTDTTLHFNVSLKDAEQEASRGLSLVVISRDMLGLQREIPASLLANCSVLFCEPTVSTAGPYQTPLFCKCARPKVATLRYEEETLDNDLAIRLGLQ